ncbi:MAG: HlyC/CorC family transporter, partial [Deltaproteobacteria bacterium]|nr:HlyC/CorC family transporter [Deltaproteobacteria bacterium]
LTLVVLLVSYLSLVLGELVPKRLALRSPDRLAMTVAPAMRLMETVARPVVWFLTASTNGLLRLFGVRDDDKTPIRDEEIHIMVAEGEQAGVFEASEAKMVKGAMGLDDRDLASLMTPRPDVAWIDLDAPVEDIVALVTSGEHDRYPVAAGSLDDVRGVIHVRDFIGVPLTHESLRERLRAPLVVPVGLSGLVLLERFKEQGTHVAIVVDEYGSVLGVVTLHDILEALIGELPADGAPREAWVTRQDDGSLLVDGAMPAGELRTLLELDALPDEREYRTAGGLIVRQLRRIPRRGDRIELAGWRIEVVDMDGHRVDALRVTRLSQSPPGAPTAA